MVWSVEREKEVRDGYELRQFSCRGEGMRERMNEGEEGLRREGGTIEDTP